MQKKIISLGFFCSVAEELEKNGFRSNSSPFDWLISDFEGVLHLIENNFEDFLNYEFLLQKEDQRAIYLNEKYNVYFFHDFNKFEKLEVQLPLVKQKYERRISRFYEEIKEPTIFIRYIKDKSELHFIEENEKFVNNVIKKFNTNNEIIYIANSELESNILEINYVVKDEKDSVARSPFSQLTSMVEYLDDNFQINTKKKNLKVFQSKSIPKFVLVKKIINKLRPQYKHKRTFVE